MYIDHSVSNSSLRGDQRTRNTLFNHHTKLATLTTDRLSLSAPVLSLVVLPQLLHVLAQDLQEVVFAVPVLELGVELRHEARLQRVAVVQEPRRDVVALVPPVALPRLHPVPRRVPGLEADVVGDALEDPRVRHVVLQPPLPDVHHLVVQHPGHLGPDVAGVAADVPGAEVDAVGPRGGDAADVLDDKGDRVHRPAVGGAGLVEGVPDEGGRVGKDLLGVVEADGLVEPFAAGGVGRRVRRVERDGAGRRRGRGQG
ncbi:hypothetical protein GQ55_9G200800 [Panicum hallii var. hallii]|uniref:Uncharacterized protein n=1 Tax=Panicum hallii var. hallii TaxID=1504633 RepID=A0A2T7C569_9POAL|nr:hypothetical protein GQ55_9G200800 [Panicum hallii var. hallii]